MPDFVILFLAMTTIAIAEAKLPTVFERTPSNQIDSSDDLTISYSNGNADIQFEGQSLTTLNGVEPNSLDSSNFVFDTEGTALDSTI